MQKNTLFSYDSEGRRYGMLVQQLDGIRLHAIKTDYDVLGREIATLNYHRSNTSFDDIISSQTKYDAVGNRRYFSVVLNPSGYSENCRSSLKKEDYWYTYDTCDRIKINGGTLLNGHIQIMPNVGTEFEYQQNDRSKEHSLNTAKQEIFVDLKYEKDGKLVNTEASTGVKTSRDYHANGWVENYQEVFPDHKTELKIIANDNGWRLKEEYRNKNKLENETTYSELTEEGLPRHKESIIIDEHNNKTINRYDFFYLGLDAWTQSVVTGTCQNKYGKSAIATARFLYDANNQLNGKANSADEADPFVWASKTPIFFETHDNGWVFNKQYIRKGYITENDATYPDINRTYQYLYNVNGDVLAGYSIQTTLERLIPHFGYHCCHIGQDYHPIISDIVPRHTVFAVGRIIESNKNAKINPLGWGDINTPMGAQKYIVSLGDSLYSIAEKIYGEKEGAEAIAKINGLASTEHILKAGQQLTIPYYINKYNKASNRHAYQTFIQLMTGSLSPNLIAPQPIIKDDDEGSFLGGLIKIIAVGIVLAVAPELAGYALAAVGLSGVTTGAIATGVVAALGDAAIQGVAIGLHIQSQFSWNEMLETGVAAGVGAGMGSMDVTRVQDVAKHLLGVGISVTTTQLIEMKAGLRDKFDARAVGLQIAGQLSAALIDVGINKLNLEHNSAYLANQTANTVTNAVLGSATYRMPLDIHNMMLNGIGSIASQELGDYVKQSIYPITEKNKIFNNPISDENNFSEENILVDLELDNPILPLPKPTRYGEESYDLSEINKTRLQRWSTPSKQSYSNDKIHDTTDFNLGFVAEVTKNTLVGDMVSHVREIRENLRTFVYGNNDQLAMIGTHLGEEAAIVVAAYTGGAIGGTFLRSNLGLISRIGVFCKILDTPLPYSLSNLAARNWYLKQLEMLPTKIDATLPLKEQALLAFKLRNEIKMAARDVMSDRARALGLPPTKTLKAAFRESYKENLVGDKLWQNMLEGAQRTNEAVDERLGLTNNFAKRRNK